VGRLDGDGASEADGWRASACWKPRACPHARS